MQPQKQKLQNAEYVRTYPGAFHSYRAAPSCPNRCAVHAHPFPASSIFWFASNSASDFYSAINLTAKNLSAEPQNSLLVMALGTFGVGTPETGNPLPQSVLWGVSLSTQHRVVQLHLQIDVPLWLTKRLWERETQVFASSHV